MQAIRLKTEHLLDPIGVDFVAPRLYWNCSGGRKQTAYQIVAADDSGSTLWDSGKVGSAAMCVKWGGAPVPPKTKVLWKVRLWDEDAAVGDWSEASFETGIGAWSAKWITGNYTVNKKERYPVDCFRKVFRAADIKKARLYMTACGLYEAAINGQRVGDFVRAPGITDYRKRVQYQTYDVTALLQSGENALTVQLADGWYRGSTGAWGIRNQYGTETKLLAQLELTHANGSVQTIATDESWDWSNDGSIRFADNKDGEVVNANNVPSYRGKAKVTSHPVTPAASNNVPVTEHERLKAKRITTPSGKTVLDFGQNIAGYAEFTVTAHAGEKIKLRFGELLDENGEFTQKNIQLARKDFITPRQEVVYTCREGENHYKTTFAIFGFQYVLVETDVAFQPEDFTAIAVYSDMERTGLFESSNALLNKFVENTVWSAKNNHADLPTDCPTRERHGWTGDAQIFCPTASYLFDYLPFAEKYLNDLYDWQKKNGCLPQIAPEGGTDFYMRAMNGSVGWADAVCTVETIRRHKCFEKVSARNAALRQIHAEPLRQMVSHRQTDGAARRGQAVSLQLRAGLRRVGRAGKRPPHDMEGLCRAPSGGGHRLHRPCDGLHDRDRSGTGQQGRGKLLPGLCRRLPQKLSGAAPDTRLSAGYRPSGAACPPSGISAAGRSADGIRAKAAAYRTGAFLMVRRYRLPIHTADFGCADGD